MKRCFLGAGTRRADGLCWWLLVSALLLVCHAGPLAAHALVIDSEPKARGQVPAGEVAVNLRFNSRLDRKRARLRLIDGANRARDLPITEDDSPSHLRAAAGSLTPGEYRVEWYVLSPDGHVTRGNVPFTVQAP